MSTKLLLFLIFMGLNSHMVMSAEKIIFIGDSLTEGYQLAKEMAFPALIQEKLNQDGHKYKVVNGGVSGSTSASGMSRLKWFLKSKPKILVLALGANDGLRGQSIKQLELNLSAIIEKAQSENISVLLAGLQMPPNYGANYTKEFKEVFVRLSKKYKIGLIPFILEGVAGIQKYNLSDGIHPNQEGYKIISKTVYKYLEPML